jgi:predicted cupin superfamily sugar epimerase
MLGVEALRARLGLVPHPIEGGYFVETYRSADRLPSGRAISTAIYYLLTPDTFSALHRLAADEVFHFYLGDPVEMLQLWPDGSHHIVPIGPDLSAGERPQVVVPRGIWQGARLRPGGRFALLGTTVAPGFDYADYESASRPTLLQTHPSAAQLIIALTHHEQ